MTQEVPSNPYYSVILWVGKSPTTPTQGRRLFAGSGTLVQSHEQHQHPRGTFRAGQEGSQTHFTRASPHHRPSPLGLEGQTLLDLAKQFHLQQQRQCPNI